MKKMQKGLAEYREKIKAGIIDRPVLMTPTEKAKTKPKSLRLAINAYCFDCSGEQKNEIKYCTVTNCPVFNVRPYQVKQ